MSVADRGVPETLSAALAAVMLPIAQRSDRVAVTAPAPEAVDLVIELGELSRYLVEHTRRVMCGEPAHDWAEIADALTSAADACRRQVVLAPRDTSDLRGP